MLYAKRDTTTFTLQLSSWKLYNEKENSFLGLENLKAELPSFLKNMDYHGVADYQGLS